MNSVKSLLTAAVTVGLVTVGTSTYAIPSLFLSDGVGDTIEISESSTLNTASSVPGTVSWSGSLGVWNLNVSTGVSSGTGTSPYFDLNSIDAIIPATSPGVSPAITPSYTLYVWFGDVGLGPTSGNFLATIGGTTVGSVTYNTYADPTGNALFGQTLGLTSQSFDTTPFSGSQSSGSELLPLPYSWSQEVIITQTGSGATSFDATLGVEVPEGGMTLVLLGSSLIALWAFGRLHKSVRA
ncbi:MAG: hypothetical protein ACLP0A_07175 [Verrucomicrobiia bacterium]